jgi:K+ transporter
MIADLLILLYKISYTMFTIKWWQDNLVFYILISIIIIIWGGILSSRMWIWKSSSSQLDEQTTQTNNGIQSMWNYNQNTINNINELSELEKLHTQYRSDDRSKIAWFFRYRNAAEFTKARNIINTDISYLFDDESMKIFRQNMTDYFEIMSDEPRWNLVDSSFQYYTKHSVILQYGYNNNIYKDELKVNVKRSKSDTAQHHIEQIQCVDWFGPFCEYLER